MKKILLLQPLFLIACTTTKIEQVKVPVYSCPVIVIPEKPDLVIDTITKDSKTSQVLKAYGISVDQLMNYQNTLIGIMEHQNKLSNELHKDAKEN